MKASIASTEIGFSWDEGSVGGGSSAWDRCPMPKADWDAMLDNYEEKWDKNEHQFEESVNRSPEQLMVLSYGVFFQ